MSNRHMAELAFCSSYKFFIGLSTGQVNGDLVSQISSEVGKKKKQKRNQDGEEDHVK